MMEVVFTFQVEKEKQEEFLEFVRTGTKPWWESHGCLAYTVWKLDGEEDWFQKKMAWPDMETMEKEMPAKEKDPECHKLLRKFGSFVTNVTRRHYVKIL